MKIIELKDVKYSYNFGTDDTVAALNGITLDFYKGEFVAVVGHNGSGKSTIAKLLNGLCIPQSGSVNVFGLSTSEEKRLLEIRKKVGVVFQNPDNQTVATIVEDDVAFGPENLGLPPEEIRSRVDFALNAVGMQDYATKSATRLSGGQKQRVAIAGILAMKPEVLVLDESTGMLDPQGRKEILQIVKRLNRDEGITVILITHFMDEAADCDRIIVISEGVVAASGGREIFSRERELADWGLDVPVVTSVANALKEHGLIGKDKVLFTPEELRRELCPSK